MFLLFAHSLNVKQFYLALSSATTLGHSRPGCNDNEGIFQISQSSRAAAPPSDSLVSYIRTLIGGGGSYSSAKMLSVYSTAAADWGGAVKLVEHSVTKVKHL